MRRKKPLHQQEHGITVIYDTLLFLTFISLAGVILLPAFIPDQMSSSSMHVRRDVTADELLHVTLTSTCKNFNYTLANDIIDPFAEGLGINTSQQTGLYPMILQWTLGKQQYHKTIGEHIAELLYCSLEFPITHNVSLPLDILISDYKTQLSKKVSLLLERQLTPQYDYHLKAIWRPINQIECTGLFEIGYPPNNTDCYVAHQLLTIPFFPLITMQQDSVILSEHWFKETLHAHIDTIDILSNLSYLSTLMTNTTMSIEQQERYQQAQTQNGTSLILSLLFDGIYDSNHTLVIPGLFSLIITSYIDNILTSIHTSIDKVFENTTGQAFSTLDTFFQEFTDSKESYFITYLQDSITELMRSAISNTTIYLTNISHYLVHHILSTLKEMISPILTNQIQTTLYSLNSAHDIPTILDEIITMLFSYLSLTQAHVTLTIWEKNAL